MKILVPLDGSIFSEAILGPVVQLADAMNAEVHLMRVGELEAGSGGATVNIDQILVNAEEYMAQVARRFVSAKVQVWAIPGDNPAQAILTFSQEQGVDLIAMSTRGRSGLGRWVFGSTADKVLQSTTTPLLLLRPRGEKDSLERSPIDALVVPLDGSELAESALSYAEELAWGMALKISLIRVVPLMSMTYPAGEHYVYDPRLDQDMENAAVSYLQQKQADLAKRGFRVEQQMKRGNPAAAILDFAEERGSSLIVMSTHGRS